MAGVIIIDDNFETLALDQILSGRAPPVRPNQTTYVVDPNNTGITGGGSSTIKFNLTGTNFKLLSNKEDMAVQFIYNDNSADERITIFLRDSQSTPAQRYGFWARFFSRAPEGPFFRVAIIDNYSSTALFPDTPWTFAANGINKVALEAVGTNFRVIINDAVAKTFTHTSFAPSGFQLRCGVAFSSTLATGVSSTTRGSRFTVYDSIETTGSGTAPTEYPIVRFG